jgi:hypothetical protein
MRLTYILMASALAGAFTAPVVARTSGNQQSEDRSASSSCSAYQQAPDGSWMQLPCKETGERNNQTQTRHKAPPQSADSDER